MGRMKLVEDLLQLFLINSTIFSKLNCPSNVTLANGTSSMSQIKKKKKYSSLETIVLFPIKKIYNSYHTIIENTYTFV